MELQKSCAAILKGKLNIKFRKALRLQEQYLPIIMFFKPNCFSYHERYTTYYRLGLMNLSEEVGQEIFS